MPRKKDVTTHTAPTPEADRPTHVPGAAVPVPAAPDGLALVQRAAEYLMAVAKPAALRELAPIVRGHFSSHLALAERAAEITVTDERSHAEAVPVLAELKRAQKEVDEARVNLKGPFGLVATAVDASFRPVADAIKKATDTLNRRWSDYTVEENRRREAALERQRQNEQAVAAANPTITVVPKQAPPEVARSITTETGGGASLRRTPEWSIVDVGLVPRDYLVIDPHRVIAAMRAGVKEIPGLRLDWTMKAAIRSGI